jgi:hypothetical protein
MAMETDYGHDGRLVRALRRFAVGPDFPTGGDAL